MSTVPRQIVAATGPAAGRISGYSHVVLVCRDMDRSVTFYRDLLGLKVVCTLPRMQGFEKQYFFELGNGELFSLYQVDTIVSRPEPPIVNDLWPNSGGAPPEHPQKLDHLAFDVHSVDELTWFQDHLRAHGVPVSEVFQEHPGQGFLLVGRIYFKDPDGNPLEIATAEIDNPGWHGFDRTTWLQDADPVPSLCIA